MRCITPAEVDQLFGKDGFSINSNPEMWRFALILDPKIESRQRRVEGRPTPDVNRLAYFAQELNRWLPPKRHRLLWLSSWDNYWPNAYEVFVAARTGLGADKSLLDAPGLYFDAHDYDNQDQVEMPSEQYRDVSQLVGMMCLVMINGWDGWLIAEGCTDRIEFWEGNLFMYSHDRSRLKEGDRLLDGFDCPRQAQ
jgi:hypothetical protein